MLKNKNGVEEMWANSIKIPQSKRIIINSIAKRSYSFNEKYEQLEKIKPVVQDVPQGIPNTQMSIRSPNSI